MPDPLDALRAKARRDVSIESGDTITVRRISMVDAVLLADDVPVPVVDELARDEGSQEAPQIAIEQMRANRAKQSDIVRRAVVAVNGKDVTIPEDTDLAELFTDEDRRRISDTALWLDAEGKA